MWPILEIIKNNHHHLFLSQCSHWCTHLLTLLLDPTLLCACLVSFVALSPLHSVKFVIQVIIGLSLLRLPSVPPSITCLASRPPLTTSPKYRNFLSLVTSLKGCTLTQCLVTSPITHSLVFRSFHDTPSSLRYAFISTAASLLSSPLVSVQLSHVYSNVATTISFISLSSFLI